MLSDRCSRLWGQHLTPSAPTLSYWSTGSSQHAGVAIHLTPQSIVTAKVRYQQHCNIRAVSVSIGKSFSSICTHLHCGRNVNCFLLIYSPGIWTCSPRFSLGTSTVLRVPSWIDMGIAAPTGRKVQPSTPSLMQLA